MRVGNLHELCMLRTKMHFNSVAWRGFVYGVSIRNFLQSGFFFLLLDIHKKPKTYQLEALT